MVAKTLFILFLLDICGLLNGRKNELKGLPRWRRLQMLHTLTNGACCASHKQAAEEMKGRRYSSGMMSEARCAVEN